MEVRGQIIQVIQNVTLDLHQLGNVRWSFDKPTRKLKDYQRINIGDVNVLHRTEIQISESTESFILAMGESDLYTDGKKFYTTFGTCIREIQHPLFNKILNESKINL
jgi:hypothetical protein